MAEVTINGKTERYDSFDDAMTAAKDATEATVKLLADNTVEEYHPISGNVTIEGGGHILSTTSKNFLQVKYGGVLAINNTEVTGQGNIICDVGGRLIASIIKVSEIQSYDTAEIMNASIKDFTSAGSETTITNSIIDTLISDGSIDIYGEKTVIDNFEAKGGSNGGDTAMVNQYAGTIGAADIGDCIFNMYAGNVTKTLKISENSAFHAYGGTITGTVTGVVTGYATGLTVGAKNPNESTTLKPGGTLELKADVTATYAPGVTVTWASSSDSIATVKASENDSHTATVTAGTATGEATITATANGVPSDVSQNALALSGGTGGTPASCSNGKCTATFTVKVEQESTPEPEPTQHTVTFDSNEGSAVESKTVESGGTIDKPNNPTRDGYTFAGWWKDETWTEQWNFTTDTVSGDMTLHARWTKNEEPTPPTPSRPTYQGIRVASKPDKTEYAVDEAFDPTGLEIREYWSDGSSRKLGASEITVSGFDSTEPGERTVTVMLNRDKRHSVSFTVNVVAGEVTVYRLYHTGSGEHFYTANITERDHLTTVGWRLEGVAFTMATHGTPVYRLYAEYGNRLHMFTTSKAERDALIAAGWRYEGIAWYEPENGKTQVHRLYNERNGDHLHTANPVEWQVLTAAGWRHEGISFNGM